MSSAFIHSSQMRVVAGDLPQDFVADVRERSLEIAIDVETDGLDYVRNRVGAIQVFNGETVMIVRPPFCAGLPSLASLMNAPEVTKVFHHAMFDLRFLGSHFGVRAVNVQCTKVAAKIVLARGSKTNLVSIASRYLGVRLVKSQQRSDWLQPELTRAQLSYAASDVIYLSELRNCLLEEARAADKATLVEDSFKYIPTRVELDLMRVGDVFTY